MIPYLIFAVITFLAGSITGVYPLYYISYFSIGLYLLMIFLNRQGSKQIQIKRELSEERIFCGEEAQVKLTLQNAGFWPIPWVSYDEKIAHRLHTPPAKQGVFTLLRGEEMTVEYTLHGYRRGFYPIGPLTVRLGDGLGLQETVLPYESEQYLVVYPRILPLDALGLPSRIVFGDIIWPQRIYQDPSRVRGLRDYQLGDSLKDIYWPATAATGSMMVKEYDSTITVENLIFLNLNQQDYDLKGLEPKVELAVEVAASIAHFLVERNQTVGLASNGADPLEGIEFVPPGQGAGHLMRMMEVLARLEMVEAAPLLPVIDQYRHYAVPGSTLLIITEKDSVELIEKGLQLCRQGYNLVLILLGDEVVHPQYLNRPYTESLVIYSLSRKEDIYGWGE